MSSIALFDDSVPSKRKENLKAAGVVFGGVLVHLSLGTLYSFGNMNPYLTSYMRKSGSAPDLTYTKCSWIYALACIGQGLTMFIGGMIEKRIGPRMTTIFGCLLMSLGVTLTYFTVQHSFGLTLLTYGILRGSGTGIAYGVPLNCAIKWLPKKKGLASGFIVAGFGGGSFFFDLVQTAYINPNNLKPELKVGKENYFQEDELIDRFPYVFLLLGACYATMQFFGTLFICYPSQGLIDQDTETLKLTHNGNKSLLCGKTRNVKGSDDFEYTTREMLRCGHFYMLYFMFLCLGMGILFISPLYKAYGQTFIADDTFLSVVGIFSAAFNGLGRIFWGCVMDRFSFRVAALLLSSTFTCLMLTLQLTKIAGKALFFIYICLIFGTFSGCYSIFPAAVAKRFGKKNFTINYGLVFSNQLITAPLGIFVSELLMSSIGWTGLFFLIAGCTFISLLLTVAFNARQANGDEI